MPQNWKWSRCFYVSSTNNKTTFPTLDSELKYVYLVTSHHWLKVVSAHVGVLYVCTQWRDIHGDFISHDTFTYTVLFCWLRLIYDLNRSIQKRNSSSRDALIRYDISIDQHLSWLTASLGKRKRWVLSYIQSTSQAQKTCFNV